MRWNLTGRDGCFCRDHCDPRLRFCREGSVGVIRSQRTFCSLSLVYLFRAVPKLVAFLLPIFRNVDGSWHVTSKLRGSTLIQVARRRSKVFQRFSASLVRVVDVQGVSRRHAVGGKNPPIVWFFGVEKSGRFIERSVTWNLVYLVTV